MLKKLYPKRKCPICEKTFQVTSKYQAQICCDRFCAAEYVRVRKPIKCKTCKRSFTPTAPTRQFCSRDCYRELGRKNKKCLICKKHFNTTKGWIYGNHCSSKCVNIHTVDKAGRNPLVEKSCEICGKNFKTRRTLRILCNNIKCEQERKYKIKMELSDKSIKKDVSSISKFYKNELIDYLDSPTGKAYIGFAKAPLMENDNGIGFKGVKLQSECREYVQCYECGHWLKSLGSIHLKKRHNLSGVEYRVKFGLNLGNPLVSDILSDKLTDIHSDRLRKQFTELDIGKHLTRYVHKKGTKLGTTENENKFGVCPLQLKEATLSYVHEFHNLPGPNKGFNKFYQALRRRFGSINLAFKNYGLPIRHRLGNSSAVYEFEDGFSYSLTSKKGNRDELYEIMLQKCTVLSN